MTSDPLSPGPHVAAVNGTTLRYRVRGRGPVVVVQAPGWGIGAAPYVGTLTPLEDPFTLVYLDPRGSSGAPAERPGDLHVAAFVEDLDALRGHLGLDTFALAGHSHGGLIAAHYALRYPERVRALLLLCPQLVGVAHHPAERDGQVDARGEPAIAGALAYLEGVGGFDRLFTVRTDAEATEFLRGIAPLYFRDPANAVALRAMLDEAPLPVATMQAVSATDGAFPLEARALAACPVATLAVSGRYDLFCPPSAARTLAETMPNARRVVFEESGHFPWIEEPAAFFREARAFLAEPILIRSR